MTELPPMTLEMIIMLCMLAITIYGLAFSSIRVDVVAMTMLVSLGLTNYIPGIEPMVSTEELFEGFSSNAVIAIIAVMIIGGGLDRSGVMNRVAALIMKHGGSREERVLPLLAGSAAALSTFVQNIGVAALYLPVVNRISERTGISPSRLLMPMAFCVILGGTATMVGSSPLVMLNDLLASSNRMLPADQQIEPFSLFSVFPIGLALSVTGLLYFQFAGRFLLPNPQQNRTSRTSDYFRSVYGIDGELVEAQATADSPLVGMSLRHIQDVYEDSPFILALYSGDVVKIPPVPDERVWVNTRLGLMGDPERIDAFCQEQGWTLLGEPQRFADVLNSQHAGIAEVVIPPRSSLVGQEISAIKPRRNYGMNILQIYRSNEIIRRDFGHTTLKAGDTLVVHASWKDLYRLRSDNNFVVATDVKYEAVRTHKIRPALLCFGLALVLFLISDNLSLSLFTGAVGMILSGVLSIDEAYDTVSWQTVFLLSGLIPLGLAAEHTGAASWIALNIVSFFGDVPAWVIQGVIALLASFFTLIMSNVGATVLLVPLAVNMAVTVGADPGVFALTVAIATSNTFLIPTNQVNALINGPGGYRVADFTRVGAGMTVLFLIVSLGVMHLIF